MWWDDPDLITFNGHARSHRRRSNVRAFGAWLGWEWLGESGWAAKCKASFCNLKQGAVIHSGLLRK